MPRPRATILASLALITTAGLLIAGPLTPPAGPVAASYKTLSEIEPRIPLSAATTPGDAASMFKITQPGSYYLAGNLVSTKAIGVEIEASNVVLDLNGFTISSGSATTEYGVNLFTDGQGTWRNVTIRNGTVTGAFAQGGIQTDADMVAIRDVTVIGVPNYGLSVSSNGRVVGCDVRGCTTGITGSYASTIEDCRVSNCTQHGISAVGSAVARCTITGCGSAGIYAQAHAVVEGCVLRDNGPGSGFAIRLVGQGSRIEANTVSGSWFGIFLDTGATDNLIVRNNVRKGGGTGGILMNGQTFGSYPNNHVAQIIVDPTSPFAATNPMANIQY